MSNNITIKVDNFYQQNHDRVHKIIGTISAKNFAKLISGVGLTANPRKSKVGKITSAIQDTLEHDPHLFSFKSKGLLVATGECVPLERGRFTLSFNDPSYEGVLDGGHNMLAIGLFILFELAELEVDSTLTRSVVDKCKRWDQFVELWSSLDSELKHELIDSMVFNVPIEIIFPTQKEAPRFIETVYEISDARNNNDSLSETTKHDHRQYYEILKQSLDPIIRDKVEWKDNDVGISIDSKQIIAMSLIPFLAIQRDKALDDLPRINPVNLYSSKASCVTALNTIIKIERDKNGSNEINHPLLISAFKMLKDLPRLFDLIYSEFPNSYNEISPGFGRIAKVRLYDVGEKAGGSYLRNKPKTKYYERTCKYQYPEGFIMPIFCSIYEMMEVNDNQLVWKVANPDSFIKENLTEFTKMFLETTIKDNDYNPNSVGKNTGGYLLMAQTIKFAVA